MLNKFVKRELYSSPTPNDAVADINQKCAKYFDALQGYHQCPLDKHSQLLTTFMTPFGRYKFLRAPFGICSISEHYNRRMDEALQGLSNFRKIVDDIVIYDDELTKHVEHVRRFLARCAEKGISLHRDKFKFAQKAVTFAGFELSQDGYKLDSSLLQAVRDFPMPSTVTE